MGGFFSYCCGDKIITYPYQQNISPDYNEENTFPYSNRWNSIPHSAVSQRNDWGTTPRTVNRRERFDPVINNPPSISIRDTGNFRRIETVSSRRNFPQPNINASHPIRSLEGNNRVGYNSDYFPVVAKVSSSPSPAFQISPISADEYYVIKRRITNKHIIVHSIEKIVNKHLESSYFLKKEQKQIDFPNFKELELFHGTKLKNVESICTNNFNWRFHGSGTGNRFGKGVSFSCNAMYAANYSHDTPEKVMFIAKVLIGKKCKGSPSMKLPEEGYDTSTKDEGNIVLVKYEDNEFYPCYLIKFRISPDYVPQKKKNFRRY